jgi:hypothetical protein
MVWGLLVWLAPALAHAQHTRQACVDGVDCYCDCVEDTSSDPSPSPADANFATDFCKAENIPIDPLIVLCEDYEDPTYENPDRDFTNWFADYGTGTANCSDFNSGVLFDFEGDDAQCRNILQANTTARPNCKHISGGGLRPNTVGADNFSAFVYSANDDDLNTGEMYGSGFDGTWDGCQTMSTHIMPMGGMGLISTLRGTTALPTCRSGMTITSSGM